MFGRTITKLTLFALCALTAGAAFAEEAAATAAQVPVDGSIYWAIAISLGASSLAASFAVGKIGAAAMGAATEKPELLGKAIALVGMGEGLALFGFLVALFLIFKIPG
ncbi:MAG: hypothetical protein IJJ33_12930 [Victivallales bacterium]|nr:hypothetical protein [Victivallales bacterium]